MKDAWTGFAGSRPIHGVDFSGARDAGRKIWIASGISEGDALRITAVERGEDLPGAGRGLAECLPALARFVKERPDAAFGCDFPFGLPAPLVQEMTWEAFVQRFGECYDGADAFRADCREKTGGRELRRVTDRLARVPFAAFNARLYRQTYHGIRSLLLPLVRDHAGWVRPTQNERSGAALLLEVCPASTLKREGRYCPYKGRAVELRRAREGILSYFEDRDLVRIDSPGIREKILADPEGDALDSVIAALATHRAVQGDGAIPPDAVEASRLEGWVYF